MSYDSMLAPPPTPATSPQRDLIERSMVDNSTKLPVMFFFLTALTWLLGANALGALASIKLLWPGFLGNCVWISYGRLWPAYMDALTYGWACTAGMGLGIWMTARLCKVVLRGSGLLVSGGVIWNLGVTAGVLSILSGNMRPYEFLEFPGAISFVLLFGYLLIGVWGVVMFRARRPGHMYISLWYLVGAFFWFPWLYATANILLAGGHLHGVMQAVVAAWFAQNFLWLFLGAIALATVYYLLPKITGKPVHSYHMASLGFWCFVIFGGWTGMIRLVGGPIPAWMITVSVAATIMLLISAATFSINYWKTLQGDFHLVYHSPVIRFVMFGALSYTLGSLLLVFFSFRNVAVYAQFTTVLHGENHLLIYAFFSMVVFGAMYYIVPRLVGCEWFSASLIQAHFWATAYGIGLMIASLLAGGMFQGISWYGADVPVDAAAQSTLPFTVGRILAWGLLTAGNLTFALHFLLMLLRLGRPSGTPTLFETGEEHA